MRALLLLLVTFTTVPAVAARDELFLSERVDVDAVEARLSSLLSLVAPRNVTAVVFDEGVADQRVSVRLHGLTRETIMEALLEAHGLGWERRGSRLRFARQDVLDAERAVRLRNTLCH